jgi:hypothetical protein
MAKSDWQDTKSAASALCISPDLLLSLREAVMQPGRHYRVKNPTAAPKGRRYLWHVGKVEALLNSAATGDRSASSARRKPVDESQP